MQVSNKYINRKIYKPPPQQDYSNNFKKLIIVIIISLIFIAGQFIGGYISGSISVISDAFHLVTDLIGFLISFLFIWFSRKKPNQVMSFGYHRMELLGALGNLFIIWALAIFLFYQATLRIINKQYVKQPIAMLIIATAGLPINIIMYFVLHSGSNHSHGLMGEKCGEEFNIEENENSNVCLEIICQDIQCLINNQYLEHCHKQIIGEKTTQIHKHKNKVLVEGSKIIRVSSQKERKSTHQNNQNTLNPINKLPKHPSSNIQLQQGRHEYKQNHNNQQIQNHTNENKNIAGNNNQVFNDEIKISQENNNHENHSHSHSHSHDHGHDHDHSHHPHDGETDCSHHHHESMSMKAAVLHALSDIIQSIGLLISALVIFFFGAHFGKQVNQWNNWHYFDPITTYIFSVIVIGSTWPITKNCYYIIMQSTPSFYKIQQLTTQISSVEGVLDVHDLHIWDLRPGKTILIAHVFSKRGEQRNVLKKLTDLSRKKRIFHSTFQIQEQDWKDHQEYILCQHDIH